MKTIEMTPKIANNLATKEFEEKFSHIRDRMSLEAEKQAIEGCLIRIFKRFLAEKLEILPKDRDKTCSKGYKEIENFSAHLYCPIYIDVIISYINQFFKPEKLKQDAIGIEFYLKSDTLIVISNYPNKILFTASTFL